MRWSATIVLKIANALLLLVAIANAEEISMTNSHDPKDFDFFRLVIQWPGSRSFDRFPCCYPPDGKPMANFLIHGLWPARLDGKLVEYCTSEEYDAAQVQSIRPDMNKIWPSLSCPRGGNIAHNAVFWEHEWQRHGACAVMSQIEYFSMAVDLWYKLQEADFMTALHEAGIDPVDSDKMYDPTEITKVLNNALRSKFPQRHENASVVDNDDRLALYVKCAFDATHEHHYQLAELWICFDRENILPMKCPKPTALLCINVIPFHTFRDCTGYPTPPPPSNYWPWQTS